MRYLFYFMSQRPLEFRPTYWEAGFWQPFLGEKKNRKEKRIVKDEQGTEFVEEFVPTKRQPIGGNNAVATHSCPMEPGSLLFLSHETNNLFQHSIRPSQEEKGAFLFDFTIVVICTYNICLFVK